MTLSAAAAKIIAQIEAKILDKINDAKTNGGTFLQQSSTVTVGGLPVAIREGRGGGLNLGSLAGQLQSVISQVQQAGDIASLMKNPMSAIEGAVSSAISAASGKIAGDLAGQITGGQISNLTTKINSLTNAMNTFEAHTSNLSGLSSAVGDSIPDFNKIKSVGEMSQAFGSGVSEFIANTASALKSENILNNVKDTLNVTVQNKMNEILRLDANTVSGQTAIAAIVLDIETLLNTQANTLNEIVNSDTHNFNEVSNNITATQNVIGLAEQLNDKSSVSYELLVGAGIAKESTISTFNSVTPQSQNS